MSCWHMPAWMERYRSLIDTAGRSVEEGMNDSRVGSLPAWQVKRQVALLIALREAGELRAVTASDGVLKPGPWRSKKFHVVLEGLP